MVTIASLLILSSFWSVSAQKRYVPEPKFNPEGFGAALACVGDVDGDGWEDVAIGADQAFNERGAVYVVSTRTREMLYALQGDSAKDRFGAGLVALGGDGIHDFLVGPTVNRKNTAMVMSGKDGTVRRIHEGAVSGLGIRMHAMDDVDSDGIPDYALAGTCEDASQTRNCIRIFSGSSHEELYSTSLSDAPAADVKSFASIGDIDMDGVSDFAVAWEQFPTPRTDGSVPKVELTVHSGKTGTQLRRMLDPPWVSSIDVEGIGDIDGDGASDFIVGVPNFAMKDDGSIVRPSKVYAVSGRTFEGLYVLTDADYSFGRTLLKLGDVDGDGISDFAVCAPGAELDAWPVGKVSVYSGKQGTLLATIRSERQPSTHFGTSICAIRRPGAKPDQPRETLLVIGSEKCSLTSEQRKRPEMVGQGCVELFVAKDGTFVHGIEAPVTVQIPVTRHR